jgi:2-isopropylmalate synthase
VNSQSGKGGVAFIISEFFGDNLDKEEAKEFGLLVKKESDKVQRELNKEEIIELYKGNKK